MSRTYGVAAAAALSLLLGMGDSAGSHNGNVVISCDGAARFGPPGPHHGECRISGAIRARFNFLDNAHLCVAPHLRTLSAWNGTIRIQVYRKRGNWMILGGTNAYAGLRGRGWESNSGRCKGRGPNPISIKMVGTVSQ